MKIRSTFLALAALTTLSLAALAPTQASAWGGGHGGGHFGGGHYGGGHFGGGHYGGGHHNWGGGYGRGYGGYHNWGHYGSGYGYRPSYPSYAPSYPVSERCDYCEAPAPVYHAQEPCECEAQPEVVVKRVYVPVRVPVRVEVPYPVRVEVPVPVREAPCDCEAPVRYTPPPVEENCNCEAPTYRTRETYAPRQQPYQDSQAVNYASKELEKK
jgi:hypothetical protein